MSPEIISALQIIREIGTWPIGMIIISIVLWPWCTLIIVTWKLARWFEEMKKMYENNVKLVEKYEKLYEDQQRMNEDQQKILIMNTEAITELKTLIRERLT